MAARHILWVCLFLFSFCGHSAEPIPGHIIAWGYNQSGVTDVPPDLNDVIAIAAGQEHNLALRSNGTVVFWGDSTRGPVPPGLSNVVAIAVSSHSVALKSDGSVIIWGSPNADIATIPLSATNLMAIETAPGAIVGLRRDGTLVAWGWDQRLTALPPNLNNIVQISVGPNHAWARKSDGSIVGWGNNLSGESIPPAGLGPVRSIEAGQFTSFAVKNDFSVHRWGGEDQNELPSGGVNGIADIQTGNQHAIALRTNGTVVAWGYNASGQGAVPEEITGVTAISAGGNHNLVITARPRLISITPPVNASSGQTVTFSVSAASGPLTYQWQHRGTNLPNQTNASISIQRALPEHAGPYSVIVSNAHGYIRPITALNLPPPIINSHPVSREVYRSETATFSVSATGFEPLSYQWWHNGTNAVGTNSPTLSLPPIDSPQLGSYRVVVTDVTGTPVQSAVATLTMIDPRPKTVPLIPVLDTSITSGSAKPQGNSTLLIGRRGVRAGSDLDRALLRFDLTSIPTNALVQSAELKLVVVRAPNATPYTFHLHRMFTPWDLFATWSHADAATTWNTLGASVGTDYSTDSATGIAGGTPEGFLAVFNPSANLQADLQTWIKNPSTNHGWIVISEGEDTDYSARHLGSSESQNPPRLSITYEIPIAAPTLTNPLTQDGTLAFQIPPHAGWFYSVETREHLTVGNWTLVTNIPAGKGLTSLIFRTKATNAHRFFRVNRN